VRARSVSGTRKKTKSCTNRTGHAAVLRALEKVLEGPPTVENL